MIFRAKSSHSLSEPQITVYLCNWSAKKHILNSKLVEKALFRFEDWWQNQICKLSRLSVSHCRHIKQSAFIFSLNLSCIVSHFIQRTGFWGNLMPRRHLSQDRSSERSKHAWSYHFLSVLTGIFNIRSRQTDIFYYSRLYSFQES